MKIRMTQRVCISHAAMLAMLRHVMGTHQFLVTEIEIQDSTRPGKPDFCTRGSIVFEGTAMTAGDKPHYFFCQTNLVHDDKKWKVEGGYLCFVYLKTGNPRKRGLGQTRTLASINFNWTDSDVDPNIPTLPLDQPETYKGRGSFTECIESYPEYMKH